MGEVDVESGAPRAPRALASRPAPRPAFSRPAAKAEPKKSEEKVAAPAAPKPPAPPAPVAMGAVKRKVIVKRK
jgi:hypothetical protein